MADDRGNVVDFYESGEKVARLDREAPPPIKGIDFGYGWDGDEHDLKIAIDEGYTEDLAVALLCGIIRDDDYSKQLAPEFIKILFTPDEVE